MAMMAEEVRQKIIGAFFEVAKALGPGFLEKVYERALVVELRLRGLSVPAKLRSASIIRGLRLGLISPMCWWKIW